MEVAATIARRFASALADRDEAAARACAHEWRTGRDGPARLFHQLVGEPVELVLVGAPQVGEVRRAAQVIDILQGGVPVERVTLLGDGKPFLLTGATTNSAHVACFLANQAPAVLAWDELTPDRAARVAAESLARTLDGVAAGDEDPTLALGSARSGEGGALVVIAHLAVAVARGARLDIVDARGLPRLGRGVISARIEEEPIFLYVDHATDSATPIWRTWTPYFSGSTLLDERTP